MVKEISIHPWPIRQDDIFVSHNINFLSLLARNNSSTTKLIFSTAFGNGLQHGNKVTFIFFMIRYGVAKFLFTREGLPSLRK